MNDTDEPVLKVERDDATLQLTLNRPHSANALNPELTETLIEAVTQAGDIRLCVIRGSGRHFCAGFDLAELDSLSDGDLLWRFLRIETLLQAVRHAPFATLALGNGQLVGAAQTCLPPVGDESLRPIHTSGFPAGILNWRSAPAA